MSDSRISNSSYFFIFAMNHRLYGQPNPLYEAAYIMNIQSVAVKLSDVIFPITSSLSDSAWMLSIVYYSRCIKFLCAVSLCCVLFS